MFSEVTRAHRLQLAITQEELAAKAGLGVRTVRDIEAGRIGRPRQGTVRALADVFALQGDEREHFYAVAFSQSVWQETAPEVTVERIAHAAGKPLVGGPLVELDASATPRKSELLSTRLRWLATAAVGILLIIGVSWGVNVHGYRVTSLLSTDREPVHISVQEQPIGGNAPGTLLASKIRERWAFNYELRESQTLAELNDLMGSETVGNWAIRKGGFELGSTFLRLVLQGVDPYVEIVNIRARAVEWRATLSTTLVEFSPGATDRRPIRGNETLPTTLNLDSLEPFASYFLDHTISLQPHKSITIDLQATIMTGAVVWDIAVDLVVAGKKRTLIVTRDDGLHFRTAAYPYQKPDRPGGTAPRFPYEEFSNGFIFDMKRNPPSWKSCVPQERSCSTSRE